MGGHPQCGVAAAAIKTLSAHSVLRACANYEPANAVAQTDACKPGSQPQIHHAGHMQGNFVLIIWCYRTGASGAWRVLVRLHVFTSSRDH